MLTARHFEIYNYALIRFSFSCEKTLRILPMHAFQIASSCKEQPFRHTVPPDSSGAWNSKYNCSPIGISYNILLVFRPLVQDTLLGQWSLPKRCHPTTSDRIRVGRPCTLTLQIFISFVMPPVCRVAYLLHVRISLLWGLSSMDFSWDVERSQRISYNFCSMGFFSPNSILLLLPFPTPLFEPLARAGAVKIPTPTVVREPTVVTQKALGND